MRWYVVSERIRKANEQTNRVTVRVCEFFRRQGLCVCVLKGQGNVLNYPDPYARTPGDVDVWVDGVGVVAECGDRRQGKNDDVVLAWMRKRMPEAKHRYHHVEFGKVDGVEVEVHYRPSFMNGLIHNSRMQRWYGLMAGEQFAHLVELPDGVGSVCVPTHEFNVIYQMSHLSRHFVQGGVGLRQIIDYYYVLVNLYGEGLSSEKEEGIAEVLKHLGLYDFACAVMWVIQFVVGDGRLMIVPPDQRRGRFLLDDVMMGGNFGKYDTRVKHQWSQLERNIQQLRRDFRLMWYFPSECLWEPVFRLWHFFWRLSRR